MHRHTGAGRAEIGVNIRLELIEQHFVVALFGLCGVFVNFDDYRTQTGEGRDRAVVNRGAGGIKACEILPHEP